MRSTSILIADTHQLIAQGLRHLLEAREDLHVVDIAVDGFAALEMCRQNSPDLLILDASIPGLDAIEICRQLYRYSSRTKVLLTLPCLQFERLNQAARCGASGGILKSSAVSSLFDAIDAIMSGLAAFPPELNAGRGTYVSSKQSATPYSRLTARERTIFKLLAEGHSVKQVANQLELRPKTVDVHKTNLMRKLDVHDRSELIHFAFREGIVSPGLAGQA